MTLTRGLLGNAPVSYGIWGSQHAATGLPPSELLRLMASIGYAGSELGPPGYFGEPALAADVFAQHGITAIGAYVPLPLDTPETDVERSFDELADTCRTVAACNEHGMIVLAGKTTPELKKHPARRPEEAGLGLAADEWTRAAALVTRASHVAAEHGLDASFHPHMCTHVESASDVDRLVELTEIPLTLDTGHLRAAGDDPTDCLRRWGSIVRHIHLKDIRVDAVREARDSGTPFSMSAAATPLGHGDVDLDGFLTAVRESTYSGWVVVEQDQPQPATGTGGSTQEITNQQAENYRWLERRIAGSSTSGHGSPETTLARRGRQR